MNNLNSTAKISEKNQILCDNLLAFAKWLDKNPVEYFISDFNAECFPIKSPQFETRLRPNDIVLVYGCDVDVFCNFYDSHSTNKERVLAALMLRSAILAGDSFQ